MPPSFYMTELQAVHTLVLDLDDTLFPEREYVHSGFRAVDEWLQSSRVATGFAETAWRLFEAGRRGKVFDEALQLLDVLSTPSLIADMIGVYRAHEPKLSLFSDAVEILEWARSRVNLALITDGYADVQRKKIRALGLERLISCRIVTDELGTEFWKPSPEPFRRVMAAFPGTGDGYVYVGDNPRKDFIGARKLGWRTVRVRRTGGEHNHYEPSSAEAADVEVPDLLALRQLLAPVAGLE